MTDCGIATSALFFQSVSSNVSSIDVMSGALLAARAASSFCWIWASGTNWISTVMPGFFDWNSGTASFSVISLMLRRSVNQAVSLMSPGLPELCAGAAAAGLLSAGLLSAGFAGAGPETGGAGVTGELEHAA